MSTPQDTATELRQASCVAIDGRAVLIEGEPGSGKSSLALSLIDRGALLVGDDGVELVLENDQVIAQPPPNIAGKLEIRNVGIVALPTIFAPLALVLRLSKDPERFRVTPDTTRILGCAIPVVPFDPGTIAPSVRAEWALKIHGLAI